MPGPGQYEGKNYMRDEPSFAVHKFQQTARPLNNFSMKDQKERVEVLKEKKKKDQTSVINEFRGCKFYLKVNPYVDESSIGMTQTRVSDVGRRLFYAASVDEAGLPFA